MMTIPTTSAQQAADAVTVTLTNGVTLVFALAQGELLGLTAATIDDVPLIAPGSCRLPYLETRDGWTVQSYRVCDVQSCGEEIVLTAEVWGIKPGISRKVDTFEVPFIGTPQRTPVHLGVFRWHLRPETVVFGDPRVRQHQYQGFSYRYTYELSAAFHWVLDSGTWEVGGDVEGITLLSQHMAPIGGPMEYTISRQGAPYTSGETFRKGSSNHADVVPDIPSDPALGYLIPIQAQLRGAGGAIVDVQYREDVLLISYYLQADYYRTLIEWRPGDPGIGHLDHHYFPVTHAYTTPAKMVLAAQAPGMTRTQALNRWTDAWDTVANAWRAQVGVSAQEPMTEFGLDSCGGIGACTGFAPFDVFARWETRFAWLERMGFQYFFLGGLGKHRGLEVPWKGNMCQPYDYSVAEEYGGPEAFRAFCSRAHQHGLKVAIWIGAHLSDFAPVLQEHPEWEIHYDCGTPWDGGYRTMRSCAFKRGFGDWLLHQLQALKLLGLDGVLIDSYHNLGAMPIDYHDPTLAPQIHDLWAFQAACEQMGIISMIESVGPIGISGCGLWPEYMQPMELAYQAHFRADISDLQGILTPARYFALLAQKTPVGLSILEVANNPMEGVPEIPEMIGAMNRLYQQVAPMMRCRTLHEDGSIEWCNPDTGERLLFVVEAGSVTLPAGYTAEPLFGETTPLAAGTHWVPGLAVFLLHMIEDSVRNICASEKSSTDYSLICPPLMLVGD